MGSLDGFPLLCYEESPYECAPTLPEVSGRHPEWNPLDPLS